MFIEQQTDFFDVINVLVAGMLSEGWTQKSRGYDPSFLGGGEVVVMESPLGGCLAIGLDHHDSGAYKIHFNAFPVYEPTSWWYAQLNQSRRSSDVSFAGTAYTQNMPLAASFKGFFWINPRRVIVGAEIGGRYFVSYAGRIKPYALPDQYRFPMYVSGSWPKTDGGITANTAPLDASNDPSGADHCLFADSHSMALLPSEEWSRPKLYPCDYHALDNFGLSVSGDRYLIPVTILHADDFNPGMHGILDGVYRISGENIAPGGIFTDNNKQYIALPDVYRTGLGDYFALPKE